MNTPESEWSAYLVIGLLLFGFLYLAGRDREDSAYVGRWVWSSAPRIIRMAFGGRRDRIRIDFVVAELSALTWAAVGGVGQATPVQNGTVGNEILSVALGATSIATIVVLIAAAVMRR